MEHQQPKRPDLGERMIAGATDKAVDEAVDVAMGGARSLLADDVLRSAEAAARAAAGAIEAEAARAAIDKVDPTLEKYRQVKS